jgi:hypothetical protein
MGRIGKTVLAIDLVNTEEIRRAFPDGIFWLTIGQNPELLRLQGELARFIAGEPRTISTVHDGRSHQRLQVHDFDRESASIGRPTPSCEAGET